MNPTLVEWHDDFALGIPDVDHEHRELIELVNTLYATVLESADPEAPSEFFGNLHANVSAHFALEEKMMRNAGYDEYPAHKEDHEVLLDDIRDLMEELEDGLPADLDSFAERLQQWFTGHFRTHDARLHGRIG